MTDEIEELSEDDYETEEKIETDLYWICKKCGADNSKYNIPYEEEIICKCKRCGKKYSAYYCPY